MGSSNEGVEFGGSGGWAGDQRSTGVDGSLALSFACFGVGTVEQNATNRNINV